MSLYAVTCDYLGGKALIVHILAVCLPLQLTVEVELCAYTLHAVIGNVAVPVGNDGKQAPLTLAVLGVVHCVYPGPYAVCADLGAYGGVAVPGNGEDIRIICSPCGLGDVEPCNSCICI